MGILGKSGPDTIDYTYLQKKGLIKKKVEKNMPYKVNSQGMIDLTQQSGAENLDSSKISTIPSMEQSVSTQNNSSVSPFNFLDNLAQTGSNSVSESVANPFAGANMTNNPSGDKDLNAMKNKVDDLEFKLEKLLEKLSMIESKLDGFEKKVFN